MTNELYFQLFGTRGSRPILDQNYTTFGGNTTSYKVWSEDLFPLYIDGGSGLFREGNRLDPSISHFTFLLTHSHWDHILAFPFFEPFYRSQTQARFWGTASFKATFEELFQHQFQTDAFSVTYSELPARIDFKLTKGGDHFLIAPPSSEELLPVDGTAPTHAYAVSTYQLNHPGIDLGYRIEHGNKAIVILTDLAPIENNHLGHGMRHFQREDEVRYYQKLVQFCWQADLLLHDTHFNAETIKGKESWGHSTEEMAVQLALTSQVKKLILGHHAPEDNDTTVQKKLDHARDLSHGAPLEVLIPREDEIVIV